MSASEGFQEQICYVQCGFCSTILLVSVPSSSLSMAVKVRCGHCTSILSMLPLHLLSSLNQQQQTANWEACPEQVLADKKSAKACRSLLCFSSDEDDDGDSLHSDQLIHKPPVKKHRAPSAYNNFIKEEIKRLKIEYPSMTHKQAFSTAAKNWAHCPQSQHRGGGEVHGCGEGERNMIMHSNVNNEVHCFGNGFNETKASVFTRLPFY